MIILKLKSTAMKKIKTGFLKKQNALLSLLMALLGFSTACEQAVDEYGAPYATFEVNGKVKSAAETAIEGIQVTMNGQTIFSDTSGNYSISTQAFPTNQTLVLEFKDIDGSLNGSYAPKDTIVEFIDPEFTGGDDNWYAGETEKTVNVKLNNRK